jgi:hypothetical protein
MTGVLVGIAISPRRSAKPEKIEMALAMRRTWDVRWDERAREEAANLNPAFCGELIARAVSEYKRSRELPFPYALSFLLLPIALHKRTRELLPGNSSTAFVGWAAERKPQLAELPERVLRLMPVTREALLFSIQHQLIATEAGGLIPGKRKVGGRAKVSPSTEDADETRRAAALLGRWFAAQGSTSSIMQGFGVTP